MTQDLHLRGARSVTRHVGIMKTHPIIEQQDAPHFFAQYTFTHTVDYNQFPFTITDCPFQRTFEVS